MVKEQLVVAKCFHRGHRECFSIFCRQAEPVLYFGHIDGRQRSVPMKRQLSRRACLAIMEAGELLGIPDEELLLKAALVILDHHSASEFNISREEELVAF